MKKIMLLLAMLFAGIIVVSAQNADLQKWVQKDDVYHQTEKKVKTPKVSNVIKDAGFYLEKSAKLQYAAITLSGVGTGLTIAAAFLNDKQDTDPKTNKPITKTNHGRTACYVGAGICAFSAICCEFASLNLKLKAGRSLQMYTTGTGGGLAYTF